MTTEMPPDPHAEPEPEFPRVETLHDGTIRMQLWWSTRTELLDRDTARQLAERLMEELGEERRPADKIAEGLREAAAIAPALASEYARGYADGKAAALEDPANAG